MTRGASRARDGALRWNIAPQQQPALQARSVAPPWPAPSPWPAPPPGPVPLQPQRGAGSPGPVPLQPQRGAGSPGPASPPAAGAPWPVPPPPGTFIGAVLPVCGVEVLIVVVQPQVLADLHEANLYVIAFHERFRRSIVLVAQDARGTPFFYGPAEIARVLGTLPFEVLPWRWLLYRTEPPPSWRLPIPKDSHDAHSPPPEARHPRTDHPLDQTRMLRGRRARPPSK